MLAKEDRKGTAWQVAAQWGKMKSLEKIWEWAKAELSTEDLNNKLSLAKDDIKQTVRHYASVWDKLQLLGRIWKWAQEQLTSQELTFRPLMSSIVDVPHR